MRTAAVLALTLAAALSLALGSATPAAAAGWTDHRAEMVLRTWGFRDVDVDGLSRGQKIALTQVDDERSTLSRAQVRARIKSILGQGFFGLNRRRDG